MYVVAAPTEAETAPTVTEEAPTGMAAPSTFVVSVSLEQYFGDERALCYMAADGSRSTSWLVRRLRRTFGLPGRVALLCRGHLLPPAEPLSLLRPGDELLAIPANACVVDLSRDSTPAGERPPRTKRRRRSQSCTLPSESPSEPPVESTREPPSELPDESPTRPAPPSEPLGEPATPSPPDEERLHEKKRRALALLALHEPIHAVHCEPHFPPHHERPLQPEQQLEEAGRPGRRRRRVRRRRRTPPAPEPEPEPMQHEPEPEELRRELDVAVQATVQMEVIRNSCAGTRAARCVRALAPPPPPPPERAGAGGTGGVGGEEAALHETILSSSPAGAASC